MKKFLAVTLAMGLAFQGLPAVNGVLGAVASMCGDLNGDGCVDSGDYNYLRGYLLGNRGKNNDLDWMVAADICKDGQIDAGDYMALRRYLLGVLKELPVYTGTEVPSTTPSPVPTSIIQPTAAQSISSKFTDGNKNFAVNVFKQINKEEPNKNLFISPISISTALSMMYKGANGITSQEMGKTLGYEGISKDDLGSEYKKLLGYLQSVDPSVTLNISNSIWYDTDIGLKDGFIQNAKENYNAAVERLDFGKPGIADVINNWVSGATNKKIDKMIEDVNDDYNLFLINAIYFKGDWAETFDEKYTKDLDFTDEKGNKSKVMMMMKKSKVAYTRGQDYKAVKLPYGKGLTNMYCILPDIGVSIDKFISTFDVAKWNEIKSKMLLRSNFELELPRFKIEYGIKELKDTLVSLGMKTAFSDDADFMGTFDREQNIDSVKHKAVIEVNEKGSEAAAVTVVATNDSMSEFMANRPFIFIIEEEKSDTMLFMGKVSSIGEKSTDE